MFDMDERQGTAGTRAAAGATCALVEGIMIGPLEVAKAGLQLDSTNRFKNSGLAVVRHCVRERGPLGAYTGYLGVQWRQSSWTGAFFGSLRFFERKVDEAFALVGLTRKEQPLLVPVHKVLAGFSAGAFASLFNCPADVVRTNVQKELISAATATASPSASAASSAARASASSSASAASAVSAAAAAAGAEKQSLSLREFAAAEIEAHWRIGRGIVAAKGLSGLYVGYFTKAGHLGGCGALMALLVPRFKVMLGCD
jgi:hypothetical protein